MITWVYSSMQAWFSSLKSSNITQISIVAWLDKQNVVHPYSGILLSLRRKTILQNAAIWTYFVDIGPIIDGQILCDFTYTSHNHRDRKQNGGCWRLGEGRRSVTNRTGSQVHWVAAWPRQLCGGVRGSNATALKAHTLLRWIFGVCILTQYKKRHNNDKKEMSYQAIKRHRGTLHTNCWVKEADLRRLRALVHSICPSQSRDPPEEAKLQTVLR